jgi:hypothetical protein
LRARTANFDKTCRSNRTISAVNGSRVTTARSPAGNKPKKSAAIAASPVIKQAAKFAADKSELRARPSSCWRRLQRAALAFLKNTRRNLNFVFLPIQFLLKICAAIIRLVKIQLTRKMKKPRAKRVRGVFLKKNRNSDRLFSSFLRGASCLKSPQNNCQKILEFFISRSTDFCQQQN